MSKLYEKVIRPMLFRLDPETAHEWGIKALELGFARGVGSKGSDSDSVEQFGLTFPNPLGMAAGFDKNGAVVDQLADLGFGFVEVGTVTLEPQPGNEKPRLFRLPEDKALINRLGFNNQGATLIAERLRKLRRSCIVGVNIGRNKDVPNEAAVENYLACLEQIHPVADYIAVNISSPNTPNLRELQRAENLEGLLSAIMERNRALSGTQNKPLLVKIAPDLTTAEIEGIVDIGLRLNISGVVATNTTVSRDGLRTAKAERFGTGGLSGKPLQKRSNDVISSIYRHSQGKLPIIGVGGIFTAEDAFEKIAAGACLVQAYTGFIYGGPSFAGDVNAGLSNLLQAKGFSGIDEAIGSSVK